VVPQNENITDETQRTLLDARRNKDQTMTEHSCQILH